MADQPQRSRRGKNPVNYSGQDADHGDESGDDFQDQGDEEHGSGDEDAEVELDDDEEAELDRPKKSKRSNKAGKPASAEAGKDSSVPEGTTAVDLDQVLADLGYNQEGQSDEGFPNLIIVPDGSDTVVFNRFAQEWADQVAEYEESRLPPIMSFIYTPWKVPEYAEAKDEKGAPKKSKYIEESMQDIPWLPTTLPSSTPHWHLALYYSLGASVEQLVLRIPEDDETWTKETKAPNKKQQAKAVKKKSAKGAEEGDEDDPYARGETQRRKLKKNIDDWMSKNRQFGPLHAVRTQQSGGPTKKIMKTLGRDAKSKSPLSQEQLRLNCAWNIDLALRKMQQPGPGSSKGRPSLYTLWEVPQRQDRLKKLLEEAFGNAKLAEMYPEWVEHWSGHTGGEDGKQPRKDKQDKKGKRKQRDDDEAKCDNTCPLHCHPNKKARLPLPPDTPPGRVPAQPLLNPLGDASDDTFWENQWTVDDHIRWFALGKGDVAPYRWPLAPASFAQPTAWHLPQFHNAQGSEGATDGVTALPEAEEQHVSGTQEQEQDNEGQDLPQEDVPRGEEGGEGAPEAEQRPSGHKAGEVPDDLIDPSLFR